MWRDQDMTAQDFWDKIADRYAKRAVGDEASYTATLDIVRGVLAPQANVLEIGCGTGSSALRLADAAGQYLGTDISPRMIEIAGSKAAGIGHLRFEVAAADAPVGEGFDAVLAFNLLHLVADVPKVLAQAHAMLKSSGVLVSKSACLGEGVKPLLWLPIAIARLLGKAPKVEFHKIARLDQMFKDAGFVVEYAEMLPAGSANRVIVARKH